MGDSGVQIVKVKGLTLSVSPKIVVILEIFLGMNIGGGGMGGGGNFGGGVNQQILQQLGIDGPVTNQVFVANVSGQGLAGFILFE